jgi:hypothetical protein
VTNVKRYKFQALITPRSAGDGDALTGKGPASQRVVVRARNTETRRYEMFRALLDSDGGTAPFRPGSSRVLVTLRLMGDDVCDCLEVGSRFDLWRGGDIGEGVITRRLYV